MRTFLPLALVVASVPALIAPAQEAAQPLKIHILSGSNEYKSEASLKAFTKHLEDGYRVECSASWGKDGVKELPNLEPLADADLMIVFARRMKLGAAQMKMIRNHWESGKPVIGIRTASHAFDGKDNELFDRKVMGGNYQGHHGNEPVKVSPTPARSKHPLLAGVKPFTSSKLYKAGPLAKDAVALQLGDIGKAKYPVTWVHTYKGGKTFYTSLGVPEDFKDDNFRRLLVNAVFWTTGRDARAFKK